MQIGARPWMARLVNSVVALYNTRLERSTAPAYQSDGWHMVSADCRSSANRYTAARLFGYISSSSQEHL